MEQIVNTFNSGINQDLTKSLLKPSQYRRGDNIRLITEGLDSSGAITNASGTIFSFTIPTTSNVVKIEIPILTAISNFTIQGVTINQILTSYSNLASTLNLNATFIAAKLKAVAGTTSVLVYSLLNTSNVTATPNITFSSTLNATISNLIASQPSPIIIGSTPLRDDFILFTTSDTSKNPGGHDSSLPTNTTSAGQIWRLVYNQVTFSPTLELLYNNNIDFTTFHPIPPSATEGRYETSTIQRVYWTDNYNELRSFNTRDLNGFALDPTLLNATPNLDFDIPILQKINDSGGILTTGIYQCAYRYKNTGGATTVYSKCSNMVPVMFDASTVRFIDLGNSGTSVTTKSITWNIDNLDTDYERIEIVILFRGTRDAIPTIDQVFDEPVPSSGNFTFTYTGNETPVIPVSLNTFLAVNSAFTHCKTIVSKTNQLLAGNVKNKTFDVDFDARAYRWIAASGTGYSSNQTTVNDSQNNPLIVDKNSPNAFPNQWGVPETHDAINPDQYSQTDNSYRFQSNGTTLGGEGPNIKYTFSTEYITGDSVIGFPSFPSPPYGFQSRFTNPQPSNVVLNSNTYPNNNFYDSFKSWYISSVLKGYQRDEIYRFAIRFYDKKGRPGFAKWIADIRMPLMFEALDVSTNTYKGFEHTDKLGFSGWQRLGIMIPVFDVTIPQNLLDKIGGWEIIRVERTTEDKSIMAAGTIHPVSFKSSVNTFYAATPKDLSVFEGGDPYASGVSNDPQPANVHVIDNRTALFRSPEFLFGTFPGWSSGDKIKIVSSIRHGAFPYVADVPPINNEHRLVKIYDEKIVIDNLHPTLRYIERLLNTNGAFPLGKNVQTLTAGGSTLKNFSDEPTAIQTIGQEGIFLEWNNDPSGGTITYTNLSQNQNDKYYAYYVRPRLSQYGGNTYSQRANSKYISTGHYQEVTTSATNFPNVKIHGGDIFTSIFDTAKQLKNWATGGPTKNAVIYWTPVETVLNTEWRYGNYVNRNGFNDTGLGGVDLGEDFLINSVWSAEDNTKQGFSKPVQFTDVQEFDTRVHASSVKINGEIADSWGIFPPFDFRDVEGSKGPITSLNLFKDNVFVIQNDAVCVLPVNQNILVPDNSASVLELGTGGVFSKPAYLTNSEGSRHQWSCLNTDSALYFFDIKTRQIMKLTNQAEPIVIIKGLDTHFTNNILGDIITKDNPVHDLSPDLRAGALATYDYQNGDVLYTFHDVQSGVKKAFTVAFNELTDSFTSFYDFTPGIYISNYKNIFSVQPRSLIPLISQDNIWLHNEGNPGEFYGTKFPCKISFLVNPKPSQTKVFDNFEWVTEITDISNSNINILNETWSTIRVFDDHQNTDFQVLLPNTNLKRRERTWNMQVPRNRVIPALTSVDVLSTANLTSAQLFQDRLRDKYIQVDMTFNSFNNNVFRRLICPYVLTKYRVSPR